MTASNLPSPGDVILHDFRDSSLSQAHDTKQPLKLLQWNIERGYKLKEIIQELKTLDADVIAIQVREKSV